MNKTSVRFLRNLGRNMFQSNVIANYVLVLGERYFRDTGLSGGQSHKTHHQQEILSYIEMHRAPFTIEAGRFPVRSI